MSRIDVVICHWNNLDNLLKSIRKLEGYGRLIVIDNGSKVEVQEKLKELSLKEDFDLYFRENKGREAGAYWFYITEIFDFNDTDYVFFSQEEIHETGMAPKGKEHLKETFKGNVLS